MKVFGEGEWKVRQHGVTKRRTWKKLHLGVDEATGEILAVAVTDNSVSDATELPGFYQLPFARRHRYNYDATYPRDTGLRIIMNYRRLGKAGIKVSELSLGAWVTYGGQVGEDVARDCMVAAYEPA